ncbi:MAG: lysophospholipase [Planctomycetes bacterium]|nr:lysophospholipase [Planctomycetota bacterium]
MTIDRRSVLAAGVAGVGGLALSGCAATDAAGRAAQTALQGAARARLGARDRVLFQGDSITDAGRSREHAGEANQKAALGDGYAWQAAASLLSSDRGKGLSIWNRGVSGNKVFQLAQRWQQGCIELRPDLLSILIGVNDIWHTKNGKYDGTVAIYERDYDALLVRTRDALPDVALVVCEPFVLRCGAIDDSWFPEFDHYRAAARRVADAHGAAFVPFQSMFDRAAELAPPEYWADDGVHPTQAGAALMARAWLEVVGAISD